jgi:hypothetical protein
MVMGGINCNNLCNTTLTVNGNFTFSVPLFLAGNLSVPVGSGTNILEFGGNVTLANTCRFSGDRFGFGADPTIRLTGASATFTVPSVVWLGTGGRDQHFGEVGDSYRCEHYLAEGLIDCMQQRPQFYAPRHAHCTRWC